MVKSLPAMQEVRVQSLSWEDPLEKEIGTHSSALAWRIPWTEKPGRLQSMGLQELDTTQWLNHHHQASSGDSDDPVYFSFYSAPHALLCWLHLDPPTVLPLVHWNATLLYTFLLVLPLFRDKWLVTLKRVFSLQTFSQMSISYLAVFKTLLDPWFYLILTTIPWS